MGRSYLKLPLSSYSSISGAMPRMRTCGGSFFVKEPDFFKADSLHVLRVHLVAHDLIRFLRTFQVDGSDRIHAGAHKATSSGSAGWKFVILSAVNGDLTGFGSIHQDGKERAFGVSKKVHFHVRQ